MSPADLARPESIMLVLASLADLKGQREGWRSGTRSDAFELLNTLLDDLQFEEFVDEHFSSDQARLAHSFVAKALGIDDATLDDWQNLTNLAEWQEVARDASLVRAIVATF